MTQRPRTPLFVALGLLALMAFFFLGRCTKTPDVAAPNAGMDTAETLVWVCPMNDSPPADESGDCPVCGMELVPVPLDVSAGESARLTLEPAQAAKAQIMTAPVERQFVEATVRMYGNIEYDPGYYTQLDAFTNGVIDKVYVRRTGEFIRPDQKLFDFYSAEIYSMEMELLELSRKIPEYIEGQLKSAKRRPRPSESAQEAAPRQDRLALQGLDSSRGLHPSQQGRPGRMGRPTPNTAPADEKRLLPTESQKRDISQDERLELQRKFAALRFRLRSYGLYDADINEILLLERPVGIISVRIPTMTSTVGGVVIENNIFQGRYVNAGTPLLTLADPHFIWARLEAFESDYPWLHVGQEVDITVAALPGEVFKGRINLLDPIFDSRTRTFDVGVIYVDKETKLRPNMLVRAQATAQITKDGRPARDDMPLTEAPLVIPASAPLLTGKRAVVYVAVPDEPHTYEGRAVELGPRTTSHYVVLSGLAEGEEVVTNGNFKLDSELQIQARPSMMEPGEVHGDMAPNHDHM